MNSKLAIKYYGNLSKNIIKNCVEFSKIKYSKEFDFRYVDVYLNNPWSNIHIDDETNSIFVDRIFEKRVVKYETIPECEEILVNDDIWQLMYAGVDFSPMPITEEFSSLVQAKIKVCHAFTVCLYSEFNGLRNYRKLIHEEK